MLKDGGGWCMMFIERCRAIACLRVVDKRSFNRLHKKKMMADGGGKHEERENNLVSRHLGEGLIQLVGDGLELFLLMDQFICSECPEEWPPYHLGASGSFLVPLGSRLRACRLPFATSVLISLRTQRGPQPASTWW